MQLRTYLGILLGVVATVLVAFLAIQNQLLLEQPFQVTAERAIPLYAALLITFLVGFLPAVTLLVVRSLQRDLDERRERRRSREAQSIDMSMRRAVDHYVDGTWSKAAAELEAVLTERPEDFNALFLYGGALRQLGRANEALDVHRRASVLYPRSIALLYQMVEDYEALGEEEVAREIRNRILRDFTGQGLQVMRRRRDAYLAERSWEEALRWHERVEALVRETGGPGNAKARTLDAGVTQGLVYQRAVALLEKDRPSEAAQVFRQLLEDEPRFIPAGIMLGEAELLQDNEDVAIDTWKQGFQSTGSPVFLQRIEDHFIEEGDAARAIETLRAVIARTENDLLPRFFLGRLYYRLEMHDDAEGVLTSLAERMDASPTYHYLLGRIHQRRGDLRAAVTAYLTCLQRLELPQTTFVCRSCDTKHAEWYDRCERCGSWNSVDFDVHEEQLSEAELGLLDRPFWGGYSGSDTRF